MTISEQRHQEAMDLVQEIFEDQDTIFIPGLGYMTDDDMDEELVERAADAWAESKVPNENQIGHRVHPKEIEAITKELPHRKVMRHDEMMRVRVGLRRMRPEERAAILKALTGGYTTD